MNLTESEIAELQERYSYLINYESNDPGSPINPLTYVDSNGDHLLHIAAQRGDLRAIELLLRAGQNINKKGDRGCTALHYASAQKKPDAVSFLLAQGASQSIRNDFGQLPLEAR